MQKGNLFGLSDIFGSQQVHQFEIEQWHKHKTSIQRQFTVMSRSDSELLSLSYSDLYLMSQEFIDCYNDLMEESLKLFRRVLMVKLIAMKFCRNLSREQIRGIQSEHESEINQS